MELCVIYNFAAHYRAPVFIKMDAFFNCDWYFGKANSDIKKMDYTLLDGNVREIESVRLGPFTWYRGGIGLLKKKDYNSYLVFAQTKDVSTWVFGLLARVLFPRKNVYFWSHGWYGKETRFEAFIKRILFHLPNGGIFLYGNYARDLMIKEGFNPGKLFVIHNSLAYDQQLALRKKMSKEHFYQEHFGNDNPNLFFVGRLTKVKQLDMALKALRKCKDSGHDYNLTFIGDGEAKEELMKLKEDLGLTDRVWFYGACYDEAELGRMIFNADLCVSPGNVGLTAIHSMVFGTPVVTHNDFSHQMPEFEAIHEGVTGCFYEYGNVDSLVDCIMKWFADHQSRREEVREACYHEIDTQWTPSFQVQVLKKHMKL